MSPNIKLSLNKIAGQLSKGETLSKAMKVTGLFDDFSLLLVDQGERAGKLEYSFKFLSKHFENRYKTILLIKRVLFYPLVILPFTALFLLPLPTLFTDGLNAYLIKIIPWIASVVVLMVALGIFKNYWNKNSDFRERAIVALTQFPFISNTMKIINCTNFIGPFLAMYEAGIPITTALAEGLKATGLNSKKLIVLEPQDFPFEYFTADFANAFKDGIATGSFTQTFANMEEIYQDELQNVIQHIGKILPIIVFVIFGAFFLFYMLGNMQNSFKILDQIDK